MALVFLTPMAFTACDAGSLLCGAAYAFTTSGGPIGFAVLLVGTGFFYAWTHTGFRARAITFLKAVLTLIFFFSVLALLNERTIKHFLKLQRPSHRYMLEQTGRSQQIDSLYALSKPERQQYFEALTHEHPRRFSEIDPLVIDHWVEEAGYSFPSGHSFNAFLFAMIVSCAIRFNRNRPSWRKWFFVPFVWALLVALSRVALGAHTPLDVIVGATLGIITGYIFLRIDQTRYWLTRKRIAP